MKMHQYLFLLTLFFIGLNNAQSQDVLTGKWTLISFIDFFKGAEDQRPAEYHDTQLSLTFKDDGVNGKIAGRSVVNEVFGDYTLNNGAIKVQSFGGTKIAEHGWGSQFWSTIRNASSYEFQNDTLIILYDMDMKGMMFIPAD